MSRIVILANTFSVTMVFRRSLVDKLQRAGHLRGIFSIRRDYQTLGLTEVQCFYPKESQSAWVSWFCLMRDPSVQVIHSFTHLANFLAVCSGIIFRKKVVLTVTGMGQAFGYEGIKGVLIRSLVRSFYYGSQFFSSATIVQNQDDFSELDRLFHKGYLARLLLTPGSGIPLNYFEGVRPASFGESKSVMVGFFSRALEQKGVSSYYALAREYISERELTFVHVGHAGKGCFGMDRIISTASSSNVMYLGSALDVRPWLLLADFVILPSKYREGLSRICIEAMLAGKIVIARETSGVRDHISDGVNGFLYNSDSDLKNVFRRALVARGGPMNEQARDYARENFGVERADAVYFKAYELAGMPNINVK